MSTLDEYYGKMEDVGRRIDHLMDLQRMWSDAIHMLLTQTQSYESEHEKKRREKLENALELLEAYFGDSWEQWVYGRQINNLPKDAKDIKDGEQPKPEDNRWDDLLSGNS